MIKAPRPISKERQKICVFTECESGREREVAVTEIDVKVLLMVVVVVVLICHDIVVRIQWAL